MLSFIVLSWGKVKVIWHEVCVVMNVSVVSHIHSYPQLRKSHQGLRAPEAKVWGSPLLSSPSGLPETSLRVWLWSKCHSALSKETVTLETSKQRIWNRHFCFTSPNMVSATRKKGMCPRGKSTGFGVWQSNVQIAHSCMSLDENGGNDIFCGSAVGIKWLKI